MPHSTNYFSKYNVSKWLLFQSNKKKLSKKSDANQESGTKAVAILYQRSGSIYDFTNRNY